MCHIGVTPDLNAAGAFKRTTVNIFSNVKHCSQPFKFLPLNRSAFSVPTFHKQNIFYPKDRLKLTRYILHGNSSFSHFSHEAGLGTECMKCSRLRAFWEEHRCAPPQSGTT